MEGFVPRAAPVRAESIADGSRALSIDAVKTFRAKPVR